MAPKPPPPPPKPKPPTPKPQGPYPPPGPPPGVVSYKTIGGLQYDPSAAPRSKVFEELFNPNNREMVKLWKKIMRIFMNSKKGL